MWPSFPFCPSCLVFRCICSWCHSLSPRPVRCVWSSPVLLLVFPRWVFLLVSFSFRRFPPRLCQTCLCLASRRGAARSVGRCRCLSHPLLPLLGRVLLIQPVHKPHIAARTLAHWTSARASFSFLSSAAVCRGAFLLLLCRSSPCPLAVASLLSAAASLRPRLPLPCWASSSSLLSCLILSLLARTLSSTVVVLAWCASFPSFSVCVFSGLPVCFSVSSVLPPPLWCVSSPPVLL